MKQSASDDDDLEPRLTITDADDGPTEQDPVPPVETTDCPPASLKASFKCQVCGESASSTHGLSRHLRRVHDVISCTSSQLNPAQHTCRLCGKSLSSASSLDRHMLVHSGERPFKCKICGMAFTTNGNMHRHTRTHSGAPLIAPLLHLENSQSRESLAPSAVVSPFAPQDFRCLICGRLFLSKNALEKHAINAHDDFAVSCPKCFALCSRYSNLINGLHTCIEPNSTGSSVSANFDDFGHLEFSSSKYNLIVAVECERRARRCAPDRAFDCERCPRSFPTRDALLIHRNRHEERQLFCVVCSTTYPTCGDLQRHQTELHRELLDDKSRLLAALQLQAHRSSPRHDLSDVQTLLSLATSGTDHCAPADITNSENSCDSASGSLLLGKPDSVCEMCGMAFKNLHRLKRHLQLHANAPFACTLCSYVSTDKSTLVRHLRTHNGERPFQCAICKYAFTTKANCERHVRKRHNKNTKSEIRSAMRYNPHMQSPRLSTTFSAPQDSGSTVCKYCNNDFKFNRVLRHHLRSLNNSCSRKPFSCVVCKLGFSTKNNCIRHVLKQHPDYRHRVSEAVSSKPLPSDGIQDPPAPLTFINDNDLSSGAVENDCEKPDCAPRSEVRTATKTPPLAGKSDGRERNGALLKSGTAILGPIKGIFGNFHHITVSPLKVDVTAQVPVQLPAVVPPPALPLEVKPNVNVGLSLPVPPESKIPLIAAVQPKAKEKHPEKAVLPPQDEPLDLAVHALDLSRKEECHRSGQLSVKSNYIDVILTAAKYVPEPVMVSTIAAPPVSPAPLVAPVALCPSPAGASTKKVENLKVEKKTPTQPSTKTFILSDKTRTALRILVNAKKSEDKGFEEPERHDLASVSALLNAASISTSHLMLQQMLGDNSKDSNSTSNTASQKPASVIKERLTKRRSSNNDIRATNRREPPNSIACKFCRRKFPWSSSLRRHLLTHTGQKPYKCPHCPIWFTTKSNCERHLVRKHEKTSPNLGRQALSWNYAQKEPPARVHCVCCSRSFASEVLLKEHQSQSEKPFRCVICCQQFAKATECAQHAESEHALRRKPEQVDHCSPVGGHTCFVCYRRVEDAIALRTHFKLSHGFDGNNNMASAPVADSGAGAAAKGTIADVRNNEVRTERRQIAVSAS